MISADRRVAAGLYPPLGEGFMLGDIRVDPVRHRLHRRGGEIALEPRVMSLLVYLGERPFEIVSKQELIDQVWQAHVVDEAVHRAISLLRSALGDSPKRPTVIETVPRHGYRLLMAPVPVGAQVRPRPALRRSLGAAALAGLAIVALPYAVPERDSDQASPARVEAARTVAPDQPGTTMRRAAADARRAMPERVERRPIDPAPPARTEAAVAVAPIAPVAAEPSEGVPLAPPAERLAPSATPVAADDELRP